MARKVRIQYPGAIYHIMNRGDRRDPIFLDDKDRKIFLKTLEEVCLKTGWQVHAYCLMPNHFHLVIETPGGNLVAGMKWLLGTYTSRFNRRHRLVGHLFSGRYKALMVEGSGNGYLKSVCDYVHLNPVRAKMLSDDQALSSWRWSSYPAYLSVRGKRPGWLRVDRLLGENGIPKDSAAGRRQFQLRVEARRIESHSEQWKQIRRGWCWGGEEFRQELLEQLQGHGGEHHHRQGLDESDEHKARRIVRDELQRLKWTMEELNKIRKGDKRKLRIARRLRQETPMTLKWIAGTLKTGTSANLARRLYDLKS
jgi:putative transposase